MAASMALIEAEPTAEALLLAIQSDEQRLVSAVSVLEAGIFASGLLWLGAWARGENVITEAARAAWPAIAGTVDFTLT